MSDIEVQLVPEVGGLVCLAGGKGSSGLVVEAGVNTYVVDWGVEDGKKLLRRERADQVIATMSRAEYQELCDRQKEKLI